MKMIGLMVLAILVSTPVQGQFIEERAVDVSIGLGISVPYDEYDITADGFYAQAELVLSPSNWIDLRPYAGMIFTKTGGEYEEKEAMGYKISTNAFMFGGKTRLTAPIPWVAPYVEIGIGGSIGSFETITPFTRNVDSGLFLHIPFSFGLELGREHNVNIEFTYYFHESLEQVSGAAAIGLSFPLD